MKDSTYLAKFLELQDSEYVFEESILRYLGKP